jgi:hypothetical protein
LAEVIAEGGWTSPLQALMPATCNGGLSQCERENRELRTIWYHINYTAVSKQWCALAAMTFVPPRSFAAYWSTAIAAAVFSLAAVAIVAIRPGAAGELASVALSDYWTIISVTGRAHELPGSNAWNQARIIGPGDLVGPYQGIATGADGKVTLRRGVDAITIFADTTIRLPPPSPGAARTRVDQTRGDALYLVAPTVGRSFEVTTPYIVAGVRGTAFAVTDSGRQVILLEGQLALATASRTAVVDLPAGFAALARDPVAREIAIFPVPPDVLSFWTGRAAELAAALKATGELPDRQGSEPLNGGPDGDAVDDVLDDAGGAAGDILDGAGNAASGAGQAIDGALSNTGEAVGGAVSGAGEKVGGIVDKVTNSLPGGD